MTIAVTGSTGALGTLVVDALAEHVSLDQVVALARDPQRAAHLGERGAQVRTFDYDRPEDLAAALHDVTDLLLISSNAVGQRVEQHRAVIEAARATGVGRIVYTSALGASDTSLNPVAPDHVETERLLADSGLDHVILRNGWYSENYLSELENARQYGAVVTSAGDGTVASADRADYAAAAAAVLTTPHAKPVYELSGDTAWTFEELAKTLSAVTGADAEVRHVSPDEHREALRQAGLPEAAIEFVVGIDAAIARGELGATTGELSALIGRPTTPLHDTLAAAEQG
ncbi:SDR family oxidoreductase [Aeromicrobium phragmitis]|uniref:SDR family oxidoreductase n=1 Tax=Aeromicrobium phragmitis TaxID=2478914 RepID=A0A3L8PJZ1_9ACTN|nr:SDR family oxidoreductase [Aeromicrobium phragmitis]RLV55716.1 SDR family oxidoreductase [Aeromicrobium phragmitis]